jgi:asparagine synthase (glutamine-hydrolysing)
MTERLGHRGPDAVGYWEGPKIAFWGARRRWLVLARDRLGIKPLYFARIPGGVAFGSEPKALLEHPAVRDGELRCNVH